MVAHSRSVKETSLNKKKTKPGDFEETDDDIET